MASVEVQTRELLTQDLSVYAKNARVHPEAQIQSLASAIERFGFTQPIIVNDKLTILAGHARFEAARRIGLEQIPCRVVSGLSAAEQKAYVIADNKISEESSWDYDMLLEEISSIHGLDLDDDLNRLLDFSGFIPETDSETGYKPETNPSQGVGLNVTGETIDREQQKLSGQYTDKAQQNLVSVVCPHCDESFTIDRDNL
tara:strand:+ start:1846 stop:2445 length:600 start_codon:yes stop_codon:yes gene_type:complete